MIETMDNENTKTFQIERGKDIQKWIITCPLCQKEFEYVFDIKKGFDFKTECPLISHPGSNKTPKKD